jgi:tetratricopeptide (TPR) repeat protein
MRLYLQRGRAAAAVRQYRLCAEILQREVGVRPDPETEAVHRQASSSRVPSGAMPASPVRRLRRSHRPLGERFVGRQTELGRLQRSFDEVRKGRGHVLMVSGEAGIGKSRLIEELTAWAEEREARTVVARCFEGEQILPFAPWASMLRSEPLRAPLREVAEADGRWRRELARLLPELGPRTSEPAMVQGEYVRIFEAIARVVETAAEQHPLLLVLEDLHWADEMSVRLLAFIGRRCGPWRVLVVASVRDEELVDRAASRRLLAEVAGESHVVPVKLAPLSESETLDLVKTLTGSAAERKGSARLARRIWRLSEGNPFMVVETMRTLHEGTDLEAEGRLPLAERIRQVILRRLDRLSVRGRRLAAVAAVIGREFEVALLQLAAGLSERAIAEGVEELVRHRILHGVADESLAFTHDRIREVAYGELLLPRRRLLHGAVAGAIETLYADGLEPHWAVLGGHYREAAVWAKAARYLRQAAAVAAERGAHREAVVSLDQALAALDRLPRRRENREQAVDIRFDLGNSLRPLGEFARVLECLSEAEREAAALEDRHRLGWANGQLAVHLWLTRPPVEARAAARRALAVGEELGDMRLVVAGWFSLGVANFLAGEFPQAEEHLEKALSLLRGDLGRERCGMEIFPSVVGHSWLAMALAERGEFDRGVEFAEESIRLGEALDHPYSLALACWNAGRFYQTRGDLQDAIRLLERSRAIVHEYRILLMMPIVDAVLGSAYVESGKRAEGLALLEQGMAIYEPSAALHSYAMRLQSSAYFASDRAADALPIAQHALTVAREGGLRSTEAGALHLLADIAARSKSGDIEMAEAYYSQSLTLAIDLGMRPLEAHCHVGLGRLHGRAGQQALAQEHLTVAKAMYSDMTMRPWLVQAEAELPGKD